MQFPRLAICDSSTRQQQTSARPKPLPRNKLIPIDPKTIKNLANRIRLLAALTSALYLFGIERSIHRVPCYLWVAPVVAALRGASGNVRSKLQCRINQSRLSRTNSNTTISDIYILLPISVSFVNFFLRISNLYYQFVSLSRLTSIAVLKPNRSYS